MVTEDFVVTLNKSMPLYFFVLRKGTGDIPIKIQEDNKPRLLSIEEIA